METWPQPLVKGERSRYNGSNAKKWEGTTLAQTMESVRRKKKKHPFRRAFWRFYTVLVVLSAVIVVGNGAWSLMVRPPSVAQPPDVIQGDSGTPPKDEDGGGTVDSPPVVPTRVRKEQFYNILLVGCDDGHGNADTMMVMGYDVKNGKVGVVSVPRDTMIDRTWTSFPKLNAAYGKGGVELLKQEIGATLGIPIDYYVRVDLKAFVEIVDELGGIDFNVPQDMYHDDEGGFVINLKKGQQHLTGRKALELVRFRGYSNADIGRTHVQQQVLTALAKKLLSWGAITKIQPFLEIFDRYVDTDLAITDMLFLAQSALAVDTQSGVTTQTLEGRGDAKKGKYSWCYELDPDKTLQVVNDLLNPYTTPITREDMALVTADSYYYAD